MSIKSKREEKVGEETDYFNMFKDMLAQVFNRDGLWSCEFCYWIDCDEKICTICERLRDDLCEIESINEKEK